MRGGRVTSSTVERNDCIKASKMCVEESGDAVVMMSGRAREAGGGMEEREARVQVRGCAYQHGKVVRQRR